MKKTYEKGIKALTSLKAKESESLKTALKNKCEVLTNPTDITSSFNTFFFCCTKQPI